MTQTFPKGPTVLSLNELLRTWLGLFTLSQTVKSGDSRSKESPPFLFAQQTKLTSLTNVLQDYVLLHPLPFHPSPSSLHMKEARLDTPHGYSLSRSDTRDLGVHFFVFGGGVLVTFRLLGVLLANTYGAAKGAHTAVRHLHVEVVVVNGQHHAPCHLGWAQRCRWRRCRALVSNLLHGFFKSRARFRKRPQKNGPTNVPSPSWCERMRGNDQARDAATTTTPRRAMLASAYARTPSSDEQRRRRRTRRSACRDANVSRCLRCLWQPLRPRTHHTR